MSSLRQELPKTVRDKILSEFNHRCAICGNTRPQIYHIDKNHKNNEISNLLPLCPNHHLSDQHNPTKPFDPIRLSLFRHYKDPNILCAQFEPIFARIKFLLVEHEKIPLKYLEHYSKDLVRFISALEMGNYYATVIQEYLDSATRTTYTLNQTIETCDKDEDIYRYKLLAKRNEIISLVVECLRYQKWTKQAHINENIV
jgi:hypothetical protein